MSKRAQYLTFHTAPAAGTGHPDHVSIYHKFNSSPWAPTYPHSIGEFDYV